MGYWRTQFCPEGDHLLGRARGLVRFLEDVFLAGLVVELAGGGIERDGDLLAGLVAGGGDGFEDAFERLFVGFQVGREAAFVADGGRVAVLLQHRFQIVEDFDAPAQRFVETRRAERHHHELLHVDGIVGVRAAIENVHHRDGQRVRRRIARIASEIFVERLAGRGSGRSRGSHRNGKNCVGAEIGFGRRAVGFDHAAVEGALVGSVHADDGFRDFRVDVADGFQHAFAEVARFIGVAQFVRFVLAGGCAGRNCGAADCAAFEANVRLDGGIAARIENFAATNAGDFCRHYFSLRILRERQIRRRDALSRRHETH